MAVTDGADRRAGASPRRRSLLVVLCAAACAATVPAAAEPVWRTPVAVAATADGRHAASANRASGTVSLLDLAGGAFVDERAIGTRPAAIAAAGAGSLVAVCESGDLVLLDAAAGHLDERLRVRVGMEPHAVAVTADGGTAWVARAAAGDVVPVTLVGPSAGRVGAPVAVGPLPRFLALAPDGATLAVACAAGGEIDLVDTAAGTLRARHPFKGLNLGQPAFAADGRTVWFCFTYDGGGHPSPGNIRRGWVTGSRLGRLDLGDGSLAGLTLDVSGRAVGDVLGLVVAAGDGAILVSAGGTHEVLRLDPGHDRALPWTQISGEEVMDGNLAADAERFRRLEVGGRPLGMAHAPTEGRVLVANALLDAVQEIDAAASTVLRSIPVARGASPTEADLLRRRGEAIFHDARRSLDQWYSCHTCHWEGGGNTVTFDTLNDGSVATYKTVLPLWHLADTGPWTWHGWQEDLTASVRKSMIDTMQAPAPEEADVAALEAFLVGLEAPSSPFRAADGGLEPAAARGRELFFSDRAGCAGCHAGPRYAGGDLHDVGTGKQADRHPSYSVPTLLAGFRKTAWLHDARARSLERLLAGPHSPERVSGAAPLSEAEIEDLAAFLRSL
ncbi:MAG: hypothetical protein ACKO5R_00515 [Planctomycetaceae bacterium]